MKNKSGGKGQQLQKDLERQAAQVGKNSQVVSDFIPVELNLLSSDSNQWLRLA